MIRPSLLRGVSFSFAFVLPAILLGQSGYDVKPGDVHPDFALPSIVDGESIQLSNFRGKKVLLIHFASW